MNFMWRTLIYFKHQSFIAKIGRLLENLDQIWSWNTYYIFQIIGKTLFRKISKLTIELSYKKLIFSRDSSRDGGSRQVVNFFKFECFNLSWSEQNTEHA